MRRYALILGLMTLLLTGCSFQVGPGGIRLSTGMDCSQTTTFSRNVSVEEASELELIGRAGKLVLRGREGAQEVLVEGRACASRPELLQQMGLEAEKKGATVRVVSVQPEVVTNGSAWMDLTVEVPAHLIARVDKTSGTVVIEDVAGLDLTKGSGSLDVLHVSGDVKVRTGSGTDMITDVAGDTTYEGGSGNLTMQDLKGEVLIREKSSGTVQITGVGKGLTADRISSGDLTLRRVNGPVDLRSKSSGTVEISDVKERVQVGTLGSGNLTVKTVGALSIADKSPGTVRISDVAGEVGLGRVGSGDIQIRQAEALAMDEKSSGTVEIEQIRQAVSLGQVGSGNLTIRSVGPLSITDKSSGTVEIDGVIGSAKFGSIGSGSLNVRNVQGDLTVKQKSSGDVTHSSIQGRVEVPSR